MAGDVAVQGEERVSMSLPHDVGDGGSKSRNALANDYCYCLASNLLCDRSSLLAGRVT